MKLTFKKVAILTVIGVLVLGAVISRAAEMRLALDEKSTPPAANSAERPDWMKYENPYSQGQKDITQENRTAEEILGWGSRSVAGGLSFSSDKFKDQLQSLQRLFLRDGWVQYAEYLKTERIFDLLQTGQYSVSGVANGEPSIIDSGAHDGAWRWVVIVPVTISVVPTQGSEMVPERKTRIRLVITRVPKGGEDGLAISGWSGTD